MGYDAQVTVAGVLLDPCDVGLPVRITHGRSGVSTQPDSPTLEFTYLGPNPPGLVGDLVQVARPGTDQATWVDDGVSWVDGDYSWLGYRDSVPKFTGSLVAVTATEEGGEVVSWQCAGVGRMAALGRIKVLMVRPVETDVQRVQAIAAEVGYVLNVVGTSDLLLAADTIDTNALDALHQVCNSAAGLLWQGRAGNLWYGTANHRAQATQAVVDCEVILDGVEWTNDQENIVNSVTITWGQESASDAVAAVWNYRTGNPATDPGTGNINGDLTGGLSFARVDLQGFDMAPVLRQLAVGAIVYGQVKNSADDYARWTVSGAVIDQGSWFQVPVAPVEAGGAGPTNNDDLVFRFGASSQQSQTYTDPDSIAQWGLRHLDVSTLLQDATQAGQLALLILGRRAQPYWRMPGVLVDYFGTTINQANRLDTLEVSDGVTFPVAVDPGPTPGVQTEWTLEGWVEEWSGAAHLLQLSVSDRRRTGATGLRDWAGMQAKGSWTYWAGQKWINALVKGVGEP